MANLSEKSELKVLSNAVAAGVTEVNSASIDLKDYEGCYFICQFGAIVATAVTSIKIESSPDDSTWNDVAGTSVTVADDDDNTAFWIDLVHPKQRYNRLTVSRATANSTVESIAAVAYDAHRTPVTNGATVGGGELHVGKAQGAA